MRWKTANKRKNRAASRKSNVSEFEHSCRIIDNVTRQGSLAVFSLAEIFGETSRRFKNTLEALHRSELQDANKEVI